MLPVRVDIQAAAAVAHSVGVRDIVPERRALFARLAQAGLFELAWLDDLPTVALATWHARQQQSLISGSTSGASVPVKVVEEAHALRQHMLKVLEYYFGDDAVIAPQLAVVRAGSGYQDLANDLEVLATLYANPAISTLIQRDPLHYQATDVGRARELATSIFTCLGISRGSEAERWADTAQRAWTQLSITYDRVQQAGRYVFANQEDVEITYPSLIGSVRASARRTPELSEQPVVSSE